MVEFEKSKTKQNLARLFAGECQDGARYQFLAQQAMADGYQYVMDQLKILAKNEMAHAKVIFDLILQHSGESIKNIEICAGFPFPSYQLNPGLKMASEAEYSQFDNIYPQFAKIAKDEGYPEIAKELLLIAEVEKQHSAILTEIFEKIKSKKIYKAQKPTVWKCSKCGHEGSGKEAWKQCPLCKVDQGYAEVPLESQHIIG